MASLQMIFVNLILLLPAFDQVLVHANFATDTTCVWGLQNHAVWNNGDDIAISLNKVSGCLVETNDQFLFGSITMQIQLVRGNSAGTVTAYYLSSTGDRHDEIDFEFLGNVPGRPYIIHTNIYTQGEGNREMEFHPWFDPSDGVHNYTIHWNPSQVVWFIDGLPIRVFRNHWISNGIAFPNQQAMKAYGSIWNAEEWATEGGRIRIDWNSSPFVARYQGLELRACHWYGPGSTGNCSEATPENWWTAPEYSTLSYAMQGQVQWVRDNYMIYDYCKDGKRFDWKMPPECSLPAF